MDIDGLKGKLSKQRVTQERLARELCVDRATIIRMFEAGDERFSIAKARKIGEYLHMTKEEMMDTFFPNYPL